MGNPGSRLRVLIADDHPLFRLGLRAGLEGEGLVVVAEAQDGKEALEKTLALNPEAVLLDLRMPVLDGLECTRMLRKKGYSGLVALLTTYQEPALVREAFLAGADAYFSKELSAPELKRRLLRVAQGEEKLKPPRPAQPHLEGGGSPPPPGPGAFREGDGQGPGPFPGHGEGPPGKPLRQASGPKPGGSPGKGKVPGIPGEEIRKGRQAHPSHSPRFTRRRVPLRKPPL